MGMEEAPDASGLTDESRARGCIMLDRDSGAGNILS